MGLHEEADELQRVGEAATGYALSLTDAGTWFDVPRGGFSGQREGDDGNEKGFGSRLPTAATQLGISGNDSFVSTCQE